MKKKVQVKKTMTSQWFERVMKDGKRLMAIDFPAPGHVEIAQFVAINPNFNHFYLRCPVRHLFRSVKGLTTYAVDVPEDEVERLREEVEEWLAKKDFG
jgi:hypothetical protein